MLQTHSIDKKELYSQLAFNFQTFDKIKYYSGVEYNNANEKKIRQEGVTGCLPASNAPVVRAAAIQSLVATAELNGIEPHVWLKDALEKLRSWPISKIDELLPIHIPPLDNFGFLQDAWATRLKSIRAEGFLVARSSRQQIIVSAASSQPIFR